MSKAAELAALIGSQSALSNRNLVINGAMQVAQRGDTTGVTGTSYGGPDRFFLAVNAHGTYSITQSSTSPTEFYNSFKVDCTTADGTLSANDYVIFIQRIEAQNLQHLLYGSSSAKKTTLSFWVRSNVTGTYALNLYVHDSVRQITKTYTINTANTWEYKKITFDGDISGSINNDNGAGIDINWWLAAGSTYTGGTTTGWNDYSSNTNTYAREHAVDLSSSTSNEWYVTGVQWEVGEQATPFEHRSYGDELARCQRYFQKLYSDAAYGYPSLFVSIGTAATQSYGVAQFITPMRAAPTFSTTGNFRLTDQNTAVAITSFTIDSGRSGVLSGEFNIQTASGLTAQQTYFVHNNNDTSAALLFSAEL
jgi:hypothetical protein